MNELENMEVEKIENVENIEAVNYNCGGKVDNNDGAIGFIVGAAATVVTGIVIKKWIAPNVKKVASKIKDKAQAKKAEKEQQEQSKTDKTNEKK
jgi:hypothetical protein